MNEFLDIVTKAVKREEKTKPYDTTAKVTRIDGDTVWVHIDGGVDETPVRKTIDASIGDTVQVRVGGGTAFLVGNATAPPTDDTTANYAYNTAMNARYAADSAAQNAYDARSQAEIAYNLAGTAKLSADGKNTIYRGATQPSGGTYVAGDTWFDTSHDNKIYRYDGTSWVAVTLGDDAIGELNASHITAGEIDASQITVSNLDAGNITTGLLDADYIDVNDVISKGSIIVTGSNISNLNNDSGFQNASQVSSAVSTGVSGKADKTDAVAKTQRIYYRSNSSTKPTAYPTAWVTEEGNKWNSNATTASGWSRKVTPISNGTGSGVTKYLYLWTATQKQMVNGTVATLTANDIALDDTTTVIDGGNIVTGTVTANKLNATDINASNSLTIGALSTSTQNDILNSNIDVGGRNLLKVNGSSTSKNTYRFADIPLTEPLVAGETYTLQLWGVSLDANSTGIGAYWGSGNNNLCTFARQNGHLTNTFTVTSAQASHADASNLTIYLYSYPSGRSDYNTSITKWKLEKGNKATDWSQAPEDIVNDNLLIDSQKMGSWQIGANASLDSSGEFGVATITGNTSWTGVIYSKPTISASILDGSPLWLSFEYQYSEATAIAVALAGTSAAVDSTTSITRTKYLTKYPVLESTNTWTKYSIQMPSAVAELTSGSGDVNSLYVQFYNYYTANSTLKIRKVKLEHGIGSTDWTPSPQDQKAYITRISDTGIQIHPANSSGNNYAQIDGNNIQFFRNGQSMTGMSNTDVRIGRNDAQHVRINSSGMTVYKGSETTANNVANYSDTVRIGATSENHVEVSNSEINLVNKNSTYTTDTKLFTQSNVAYLTTKAQTNNYLGGFMLQNISGSEDIKTAVSLSSAYSGISSLASSIDMLLSLSASNGLKLVNAGTDKFIVSNTGKLTIEGHSSAVGSIVSDTVASSKSVTAGTATNLCSITLTAGVWVVVAQVRFPNASDSTYRLISIRTSSTDASNPDIEVAAINGYPTNLTVTRIMNITESKTYYLNVQAGKACTISAGTLDAINYIKAVRIA